MREDNGRGDSHGVGSAREQRMGPRMREDKGGEIITGQALRGNNGDGSPHARGQGREVVVVWCDRMGRTWTEKELDFRDAFQ